MFQRIKHNLLSLRFEKDRVVEVDMHGTVEIPPTSRKEVGEEGDRDEPSTRSTEVDPDRHAEPPPVVPTFKVERTRVIQPVAVQQPGTSTDNVNQFVDACFVRVSWHWM